MTSPVDQKVEEILSSLAALPAMSTSFGEVERALQHEIIPELRNRVRLLLVRSLQKEELELLSWIFKEHGIHREYPAFVDRIDALKRAVVIEAGQ